MTKVLEFLEQVDEASGLVAEMRTIKTRTAPKNRNKVCGITRLGGMTKSFEQLRDLAEYIAAIYGEMWTDTLVTLHQQVFLN